MKNGDTTVQPDMWPHDELWSDEFTLLGVVDGEGRFIPNPSIGGGMVN